ncbi:hypothetical protein HHI36_022978 [Cryptolaemus montrouzieri]|uniref:Uncharacterized protein n=1 Tax=Cryptolaemus montrouzieri TaxID=559131 RepID=A0ABD2PEX9_9CUCU
MLKIVKTRLITFFNLEITDYVNEDNSYESLRANRISSISGEGMKSLIYGGTSPEPIRVEKNDNWIDFSKSGFEESKKNNTRELLANRSSSIEGGNMKDLIHGRSTSQETNRAVRKRDSVDFSKHGNTDTNEDISYRRLPANRASYLEGEGMKNLIYGDKSQDTRFEKKNTRMDAIKKKNSNDGFDRNQFKELRSNRRAGMGGDSMKNLIYGDVPRKPVSNVKKTISLGKTPLSRTGEINKSMTEKTKRETIEIPRSLPELNEDIYVGSNIPQPEESTVNLSSFSSELPPKDVMVPYNFLDQFAPEFGGNIERAAVTVKHGNVVNCTCVPKHAKTEPDQPCVRHIEPKNLQFYLEATKVQEILNKPMNLELEKKVETIEQNLSRKYPNYYQNFIQKFSRNLPKDYYARQRRSKLDVVTSCRKLLTEEEFLSNEINDQKRIELNRNVNFSGKVKDLDNDFEKACTVMKENYPSLYVQLMEKYDFPSLALEKEVVEQNRNNLLEISKLDSKKLREFDNMFKPA